MGWYDNAWNYRFKVTSDNTKVAAAIKGLAIDLSNAPSGFWSTVKSDGADIRVTQSNGTTEVARDVISIDTTEETGLLRIDTGDISTSADTDYYIYYGNSSATEPAAGSTYGQYNAYDDKMILVSEYFGDVSDRTGNLSPTSTGIVGFGSGQLGGSVVSNYSNNSRIDLGDIRSFFNDEATVYQWVKLDNSTPSVSERCGIHLLDNANIKANYPFTNGLAYFATFRNSRVNEIGLSSSINREQWHKLTIKSSPGTNNWRFYQNLELIETASGESSVSLSSSSYLLQYDNEKVLDGEQGTVMILNKSTSDNEDLTFYNNESDNASFWTFGTQESPFTIKGKVTLNSTNVEGAKVRLINDTTNEYVGDTLSDASGDYEFEVGSDTDDFHAMVEYESGENKYHAVSYPFVKAGEFIEVSGATDPVGVNGDYVEDGTQNGEPAYTNGDYWLWYDGGGWVISLNKGDSYDDYIFFKNYLENEEDGKYGIVLPFDNTLLWQREVSDTTRNLADSQSYASGLTLGGHDWVVPEDYELLGDGDNPQEGSLLYWMNEERGYDQGTISSGRSYGSWLNDNWGFTGFTNEVHWSNTYSDPPTNEEAWVVSLFSGIVYSGDHTINFWVVCVSRNAEGWEVEKVGSYFNGTGSGSVVVEDL